MSEIPKTLPRMVHVDSIHETPLIFGVKAEVGSPKLDGSKLSGWEVVRGENTHRFHIATICNIMATQFFEHKGEKDFIPVHPHMRCAIKELVSDGDFESHALSEFARLNREKNPTEKIKEECPVEIQEPGPIMKLTRRLVEAFEQSVVSDGRGLLGMDEIHRIRDQVFKEIASSGEEKKQPARRSSSQDSLTYSALSIDEMRRAQQKQREIEDDSGGCDPKYLLGAAVCALALGALKFASDLFIEDPRQEQRVSRVDKGLLGSRVVKGSGIY